MFQAYERESWPIYLLITIGYLERVLALYNAPRIHTLGISKKQTSSNLKLTTYFHHKYSPSD